MSYATRTRNENNVVNGDLLFGLSLMSYLGEGNIIISPTSIRTALAMLYEGANGDTPRQIAGVAILPEDALTRQNGFKKLTDDLNAPNVPYTLKYANGMWVDRKYPLDSGFKHILKACYGAEAQSADFTGNPENERVRINGWARRKTLGKIPEVFGVGSIDRLTILALANALYFKAEWEKKFDPQYTRKQDYTLSNGETVQVDMMRKGAIDSSYGPYSNFSYTTFDGVKVVALPYKGNKLVKMVMLPPKGSSVRSLEQHLRDAKTTFMDLYSRLEERNFAQLEIPRHEIRGSYDLIAPLKAMGIDRIFALETAELGGIGEGPLFVNQAAHKTYFKTDEEGSEGAAILGFVVSAGPIKPPINFVADRPFLEAVVSNETGALLFLNRIEDPR